MKQAAIPYYTVFKVDADTGKLSNRENLNDKNEVMSWGSRKKFPTIFMVTHEAGKKDRYTLFQLNEGTDVYEKLKAKSLLNKTMRRFTGMNNDKIAEELVKLAAEVLDDPKSIDEGRALLKKVGLKPRQIDEVLVKGKMMRVFFKYNGVEFSKKALARMAGSKTLRKLAYQRGVFIADLNR